MLILSAIGRNSRNIPRSLSSFSIMLAGTSPTFFKRLYRMSRQTFIRVAEILAHSDSHKFRKSSTMQRLSVKLRGLASSSYLDIAIAHNIPISSVYYNINDTLQRIDNDITIRLSYNDETWLLQ